MSDMLVLLCICCQKLTLTLCNMLWWGCLPHLLHKEETPDAKPHALLGLGLHQECAFSGKKNDMCISKMLPALLALQLNGPLHNQAAAWQGHGIFLSS
jgi:hypothetical protein